MLSIDGVVASEAAAAGDVRRLTDRSGWLGDVRAGPEEGEKVPLFLPQSEISLSLTARGEDDDL